MRVGVDVGRRRPEVGLLPVLHRVDPARWPAGGSPAQTLCRWQAARRRGRSSRASELKPVLAMLLPTIAYVVADRAHSASTSPRRSTSARSWSGKGKYRMAADAGRERSACRSRSSCCSRSGSSCRCPRDRSSACWATRTHHECRAQQLKRIREPVEDIGNLMQGFAVALTLEEPAVHARSASCSAC